MSLFFLNYSTEASLQKNTYIEEEKSKAANHSNPSGQTVVYCGYLTCVHISVSLSLF